MTSLRGADKVGKMTLPVGKLTAQAATRPKVTEGMTIV
jgi:hypothetical protein